MKNIVKIFFRVTIYLDKLFIGKGIGPIALKKVGYVIMKKYKKGILIAQVKQHNVLSIKAFEKAGFKVYDRELIEKHITMAKKILNEVGF